jgi:hypothetical protein
MNLELSNNVLPRFQEGLERKGRLTLRPLAHFLGPYRDELLAAALEHECIQFTEVIPATPV